MPIYQYKCDGCGKESEQLERSYELPFALAVCQNCGGALRRIFSPSFLQWRTSKGDTIGFETKRKFTQPHKSFDAPKGTYFSIPDNPTVKVGR